MPAGRAMARSGGETKNTTDVPRRSSTSHATARKSHHAKFPAGSTFGEGKDGADSTWDHHGA